MLGDINDREIADEKTIRQYAKGEQQERELRQNADASESHHGRPAQPHSRKAVNRVNTLTPRLSINNARKPTSGRNPSRNHLFSAYATVNCPA